MHKYYEWQLIENLPLAALGELLSFAHNEEEQKAKEKLEEKLFPFWLANYAITKIHNETAEVMDFEEFLQSTLETAGTASLKKQTKSKKQRTAEDIIAELMPFVEADRKKGG